MSRKVCKKCKIFIQKDKCPMCQGTAFTDSWEGRFYIFDAEKSEIAKNLKINSKGEYAIKAR